MTTKKDFKLLQFQPAQIRKARKDFWGKVFTRIKSWFHRPRGYEKYRFVGWIHFTDINHTEVTYQNINTGRCHSHRFSIRGKLDWETVDLWLRNKK